MIEAQKLRIGNWVLFKGKPSQIYSITKDVTYKQEPIPITPEILEKCGFEYGKTGKKKDDSFTQYWDIKTPQHEKNLGSWIFTIVRWWHNNKPEDFVFSHHNMRCDCKYLHQLQNLYFALTGKEINYQP